ncbi:DNA-directed RNA polymerase III subunit RPC4 [Branchiostoma belcheri]|nr:DNA-directed RNA polymerase III subunit RPC4 [Branchiostoma belcheri]
MPCAGRVVCGIMVLIDGSGRREGANITVLSHRYPWAETPLSSSVQDRFHPRWLQPDNPASGYSESAFPAAERTTRQDAVLQSEALKKVSDRHQNVSKMDPWEAASIRGHRTEIVQSLRVQDVRSYMIQEGVMDPEHFEDIECERTRALKVERFLDILATRGPRAFPVFLTALEDFGYPHLADMLLRAPTDVDGCLGGVVLLEDTIAKCRENLKKRYLSEYGWIQPIPWNPAFRLHLDEVYTNLAIVEGKRRSVSADCMDKSYSFQEEWLFDDGPSCVLVEGPAGIGKTMLCHKIAYDWAQGTVHSLKKFKLVFLVEMNKISFPSMKDVIVKIIAADEAVDDEVEAIWDFVSSNPEQILVIMDGLDESHSTPGVGVQVFCSMWERRKLCVGETLFNICVGEKKALCGGDPIQHLCGREESSVCGRPYSTLVWERRKLCVGETLFNTCVGEKKALCVGDPIQHLCGREESSVCGRPYSTLVWERQKDMCVGEKLL